MSTRRPGRLFIAAATISLSTGALLGMACKVPNENHCLHKAADANAWCAERDPTRPFCSPCEAANHGCVAAEPSEALCPEYSATGTDTDDGTDTGSESGT